MLPLKNHVMLGAGEPSAVQDIVASLPSKAVRFAGGWSRIGTDAEICQIFNLIFLISRLEMSSYNLPHLRST